MPSLDGDILVALAGTTNAMTGREVARQVGHATQRGVANARDRLVTQGIVSRDQAGAAFLHTLNRDHVAASAVAELAGLRAELLARLRGQIDEWLEPPVHASLFGSAARGDGDVRSDVDIFVVRPTAIDEDFEQWRAQVSLLGESVIRWTGNHAGISEIDEGELRDLVAGKAPVIRELRDSAVDLAGVPLRRLLRISR